MDFEITEEDLELYTLKTDIIDSNGVFGYREQEKILGNVLWGLIRANHELEDVILFMSKMEKTNKGINCELKSFIGHYKLVRQRIDILTKKYKEKLV